MNAARTHADHYLKAAGIRAVVIDADGDAAALEQAEAEAGSKGTNTTDPRH